MTPSGQSDGIGALERLGAELVTAASLGEHCVVCGLLYREFEGEGVCGPCAREGERFASRWTNDLVAAGESHSSAASIVDVPPVQLRRVV